MAKHKCQKCGKRFESTRATARFCSTNCRVKAAKKAGVNSSVVGVYDVHEVPLEPPTKALEAEPYDREKNLQAFIKMGVAKVDWLSTGIPEFDALTQIPRGRVTQIQGPYGVGKTTLCLNMIKGMRDKRVLYIDTEAALNPDLLADLQLEARNFTLYNESSYIEDISDVIRHAAMTGEYELIILDSVPMTSTKSIADSDITAHNIGQKAFIIHKLMELIAMDLKRTNTAMVFINQEREMIGAYGNQKYTPGGTGIPFQASLIVALKSIKSWRFPDKPKDHIYLGQEVEATIIKSKVNRPWRVAKFKIYYPSPATDELEASLVGREAF